MAPAQDASSPPGEGRPAGARPPEIVTARLRLNRLTPADTAAFFAYRSLPEICRYQSFDPADADAAADFIAELAAVPWDRPGTWSQLAVREQRGDELVGDLGVHFLDADQVEIGFTIAPPRQRRGYATEAVRALLDHLLGAMGKHRVTASVDPRNEASVRVLRRLGLRQEAHFRQSLSFKGEWADDLVFAVLAAEWRGGTMSS
jgi:RimJ/RimL family protein N-acetyltransferase